MKNQLSLFVATLAASAQGEMKKSFIAIVLLLISLTAIAQDTLSLAFKCQTVDGLYVQPDSITIENLTQGWKETLMYPDTQILLNVGTGIYDVDTKRILSLQVSPNPFEGAATVNLNVTESSVVTIEVVDILGRIVNANNFTSLQSGTHIFRVILSNPGAYVLTAFMNGKMQSAKLMNTANGGKDAIEYEGGISEKTHFDMFVQQGKSSPKGISQNSFQWGDQMRYVAYSSISNSNEVVNIQNQNELITLFFDSLPPVPVDGQPCIGADILTDYDGNVYNTVQIGSQCWMKENLRTTHYADGINIPANDVSSSEEPYYYDYTFSPIPLARRGYLYNWEAVMCGASAIDSVSSGVQGVCPYGWHVPSAAEWAQLISYVSSQNQYWCDGDSSNNAKALAATTDWNHHGSISCIVGNNLSMNNATGFSAIPAGFHNYSFVSSGDIAAFWSATTTDYSNYYANRLSLSYSSWEASIGGFYKWTGLSVRCLRD